MRKDKPTRAAKKKGLVDTSKDRAVPHDGVVEHVQKAPCSVEFSRDAKGQARWGIKLYGERGEMDVVVDEVLKLDERLHQGSGG